VKRIILMSAHEMHVPFRRADAALEMLRHSVRQAYAGQPPVLTDSLMQGLLHPFMEFASSTLDAQPISTAAKQDILVALKAWRAATKSAEMLCEQSVLPSESMTFEEGMPILHPWGPADVVGFQATSMVSVYDEAGAVAHCSLHEAEASSSPGKTMSQAVIRVSDVTTDGEYLYVANNRQGATISVFGPRSSLLASLTFRAVNSDDAPPLPTTLTPLRSFACAAPPTDQRGKRRHAQSQADDAKHMPFQLANFAVVNGTMFALTDDDDSRVVALDAETGHFIRSFDGCDDYLQTRTCTRCEHDRHEWQTCTEWR
jgi:hypothetical protein